MVTMAMVVVITGKYKITAFVVAMTMMVTLTSESIRTNITSRWTADLKSDSWLSKNVRPLVLVFLIVCTMLLIFIDAGALNFEVKSSWVDLLQLVLITVIGAYFGGRSLEKVKK